MRSHWRTARVLRLVLTCLLALGLSRAATGQTSRERPREFRVRMAVSSGALETTPSDIATDKATGTLSLSIPLSIPQSRQGMAPPSALTYNSRRGTTWLGQSWGYELTYIERRTKG